MQLDLKTEELNDFFFFPAEFMPQNVCKSTDFLITKFFEECLFSVNLGLSAFDPADKKKKKKMYNMKYRVTTATAINEKI